MKNVERKIKLLKDEGSFLEAGLLAEGTGLLNEAFEIYDNLDEKNELEDIATNYAANFNLRNSEKPDCSNHYQNPGEDIHKCGFSGKACVGFEELMGTKTSPKGTYELRFGEKHFNRKNMKFCPGYNIKRTPSTKQNFDQEFAPYVSKIKETITEEMKKDISNPNLKKKLFLISKNI